ncbi:hypothetical protein JTE90_009350 [Oedothorax gibbosus]|uniref:F-box domain-containing protein n=1 Tax=Oedothorax gibbosus TaxID=931172 RepID=A0AAV6VUK3_9ARAC|nr:hypothetical protein JTE90_009350 [Oedothorax gibbosus]
MKAVELEEDTILYQMQNEAAKRGRKVLSLRASKVVDFSSQYGSNDSISYTAENLIGSPTIYPRSGDNAYSFQLRTYGKWWHMLPSSRNRQLLLPSKTPVESQDFIEFQVEERVAPLLIRIYEVYNPGAIVKLLCYCYDTRRWVVLWQDEPQVLPSNQSNCFTVEMKGADFLTDYYRIEFYHQHLNYFFEIDGLILYGEENFSRYFSNFSLYQSDHLKRLFRPPDSIEDNTETLEQDSSTLKSTSSYFDMLPDEVMHFIIGYLDLQSLCLTAKVSKQFRNLCYDPVLYKNLDLQLYWHLVDSNALNSLKSRLTSLQKLNLSWCGGQERITSPYFIEFLKTSCELLTSLNLSNCPFVDNNCLKAVAYYCPSLKELQLQSCRSRDLTQNGFKCISAMTNLTYLDLYRTLIGKSALISVIRSLKLEHLFLGSCTNIQDINEVARAIGQCLNYTLKSLDLWRISDLTCLGMNAIAENCHNLVELDLGWCHQVDASCGCIRHLITHCPMLKKLFLTAIRTISSNDINAIACHCPDLEQLDILGTPEVSYAAVKYLLQKCKKLKLLDISYCNTAVNNNAQELQATFENVKIQCSLYWPLNFVD